MVAALYVFVNGDVDGKEKMRRRTEEESKGKERMMDVAEKTVGDADDDD